MSTTKLEKEGMRPTPTPSDLRQQDDARARSGAMDELDALDPPARLSDPDLTENALAVLERRYFKKDPETGKVAENARQCFWRVASHVAKGELRFPGGTPESALAVAEEFYGLLARRLFMPNSPTLMNAALIRQSGVAMRMSAASARTKPPPAAAPCIRATIGCGQRFIASMMSRMSRWIAIASAIVPLAKPAACWLARSSPALNARPAPRSTTTRQSRRR